MLRSDQETQHVRHDQSDEADRAAEGDHHSRDRCGQRQQEHPAPLRIDPEGQGALFTAEENIQIAGEEQDDRHAKEHHRGGETDVVPTTGFQATHQPEEDLTDHAVP